MNYYELLEVSSTASLEVIKNAYKTLAKKYHPDTYRGDTAFAEEKMKLLNEAVAVLSDEEKRSGYDRDNGINLRRDGSTVFTSTDTGTDRKKPDDSYMSDIDEFLKQKPPKKSGSKESAASKAASTAKKSTAAKQPQTPLINMDKEAVDFIKNSSLYDIGSIDEYKTPSTLSGAADEIDEESFDEVYKSLKKRNQPQDGDLAAIQKGRKTGRWYIITIALLLCAIVILIFLIMRSVNLGNLKSLLGGKTPAAGAEHESDITENIIIDEEADDAFNFEGMDDGTGPEPDTQLFVIPQPTDITDEPTQSEVIRLTEKKTEAPTKKKPESEQTTIKNIAPAAATTEKPETTTVPTTAAELTAELTTEPTAASATEETATVPTEAETIAPDTREDVTIADNPAEFTTPEETAEATTEEAPPQPDEPIIRF